MADVMHTQPLLLLETTRESLAREWTPTDETGLSVALSPDAAPHALRAALAAGGVHAIRVAAGESQDLAHPVAQVRARSRERVCAVLDVAAEHCCGRVVLEPTRRAAPDCGSYALSLAWISECATELSFEADARSVDLLFDIGPAGVPLSPMDAGELIERSESPWLGVALDLGCAQRLGDAASWIEWLAGSARYMRITDCDPSDGSVRTVSDARGAVDWRRVARALCDSRFDGVLAVAPDARDCAAVALLIETVRGLRTAGAESGGARGV